MWIVILYVIFIGYIGKQHQNAFIETTHQNEMNFIENNDKILNNQEIKNKLYSLIFDDKGSLIKTPKDVVKLYSKLMKDMNKQIGYIQIGANDGNFEKSNDYIQEIIFTNKDTKHWKGIMIEPSPYVFQNLHEKVDTIYGDSMNDYIKLINGVYYSYNQVHHIKHDLHNNKLIPFYIIDTQKIREDCDTISNIPHWYLYQVSSIDKNIPWSLLKNTHWISQFECLYKQYNIDQNLKYIKQVNITGLTSESILKIWNKWSPNIPINLFISDTEGFDFYIIPEFIKMDSFKPLIIIYEEKTIKLNGRKNLVLKSLHENGYKTFGFEGDVIGFAFESQKKEGNSF